MSKRRVFDMGLAWARPPAPDPQLRDMPLAPGLTFTVPLIVDDKGFRFGKPQLDTHETSKPVPRRPIKRKDQP